MMSLFSPFNPISTNHLSLNWMMVLIPILLKTTPLWKLESKTQSIIKTLTKNITILFKSSITKVNYPNLIMIVMIMMLIMMFNLYSLMPYTFPITSHIAINLPVTLTLWMSLIMKKMKSPIKLMSNLTPNNTPTMLIPFMVMIELISIMIQPITLSIRLTANMTAGHIMIILISQMYHIKIIPTLILNMMMLSMEMGVSIIQAYVLAMLIIMYNK